MPSKAITSALGLYRTPNQLGGAQDGGSARLDNCVIRSKDVVEPRRGQTQVAAWVGGNASDIRRINTLYQSSVGLLAHYGSGTTCGIGSVDDSFTTTILSDVDTPSPWIRTRFADSSRRCYATSDVGLKRINSSLAGAAAGGLRPIAAMQGGSYPAYNTSGQLAANTVYLYRAELVSFAPDGSEMVGPPTARIYIRVPPSQTSAIGGVVRNANVTTVTLPAAHGLLIGSLITGTFDAADTGAGEFTTGSKLVASVPTAKSFTYSDVAANYTSTATSTWDVGPAQAIITVYIPSTATTSDMIRIYRSEAVTGSTTAPSEDVYQVYEALITSTQISNGFVQITDNTPEVMLGKLAYFSPSVEGDIGSNELPPLAWCVAPLGDALVLGNLTYKHKMELRLLATGSPNLTTGDTITFTRGSSNFTITANTSFNVYNTAASPGGSVARDIENTANSIVEAINTLYVTGTNTFLRAEYISNTGDAPGIILLETYDFVSTAFSVISSESASWAPNLPSSGTTISSKQEIAEADIAISKSGQPDAFPAIQRLRVGTPGEKILEVKQVRDKAIILKEASAWLLSGAWPNLRVELLDDTVEFPLPDTAAVMDGQLFVLSSIGVVSVSEAGVANMGGPIEGDTRSVVEQAMRVKALLTAGYSNIHCLASWGAVDELEHRYLLGVPSSVQLPSSGLVSSTAQQIDGIWVFNGAGRAWSYWPSTHRHAAQWKGGSSSSRLVFARNDKPGVLKEAGLDANSVLQFSDYLGESLVVSGISGSTLQLLVALTGAVTLGSVEVGDALYVQSTGFYATVVSISGTTITVDNASGLSNNGTVLILKGYQTRAEPSPITGDALPADKQSNTIHIYLSDARFYAAKVYGQSELTGEILAKTLSRPGYGSGTYGDGVYGVVDALHKERIQFPKDAQRGVFHSISLRTREAGAFWRLHGMSLDFEAAGSKGVR